MKMESTVESYPLSPMQEGMVFHSLSAREPGVDVEQILCLLHEDLDGACFQRAWQLVVDRHAILRTSFQWEGAVEPRQEVHPHVPIKIHFQDWRAMPETERQGAFEAWLQADRLGGFDLSKAPLMRLALFRFDGAVYQLAWTFHHLLLDGRAVTVVLKEVFRFYEALRRGEELQLPSPRPFRDYIEWLRRQDLSEAESFWRETLKGFSAPTPLVAARAASCESGMADIRGEQEVRLSAPVTTSLKSMAKDHGLTLNTLVQGAWALLLSRYSGEEDVVFGAIRACRRSSVEGAESIVGLFINTVPMRVRVDDQRSLLSWLGDVRNTWVALRPHEHTPLVNIQGWTDVPRGRPLFESIFNFQDPSWDAALRAQGGEWANREFWVRSQSNYPLVVDAYGGEAVILKILYHRSRFDDPGIARMLGHFRTLLEGMAVAIEQPLAAIPMLTEGERRQLLTEWNDTHAGFPSDRCVHQLFEEQVAQTPDALAVSDDKTQLTYRALDQRANRIATRLQVLGVGPEVRVGVCMKRTVDSVAALLSVWKAGGAYVPLDPAHPWERLAFMIKDTRMPVLLTDRALRGDLHFGILDIPIICVEDLVDDASGASKETLPVVAKPHAHNLAYVIYTSGSTGAPKGVEIEHANLVNLITWHQRTYCVTPADRATQLANPAFDASVWELWPYLTIGASIHIADDETRLSPTKLWAWLTARQITLTFIPTPIAEAMLHEPWPDECVLCAILTGGDKLHRPPEPTFPCVLFNHYGPTENTVVTTWCVVPPASHPSVAPPIGRPISNAQVYVLDRRREPVPVGVPGELHIGGAGLARGYLNRADLTAEKFITNPFSKDPGARLYKTGDLVRWLPDGNIEFLGRIDHQVKIRGNRIELGEIESVLGRHPSVREVAVTARSNERGKQQLVAYIVSSNGHSPSTHDLRDFLKRKLPDCMVPSAFVTLDAFPLTPNGKLDRNALPDPKLETGFVAPRTPTEEKLADIWRDVLGGQRAGIHDNFFDLGGHSLLATQVISRIRSAFEIALPFNALFEAPTIAELAERIGAAPGDGRAPAPANAAGEISDRIVRSEWRGEAPLSFAQERLWFLEQLEPGLAFNNIPIALCLEGSLNAAALERALNEIVRRHETFRTTFENRNGRPVARIASKGALSLVIHELSKLPEGERSAEARRLIAEEAQRPFDLTRGPLLRAKLVRLSADENVFVLTTHHIACDGWSMGVFWRELSSLYEAFVNGCPATLTELPVAYADFAQWQRQWLQGSALDGQLAHWKQQLQGAQAALGLPTARSRPPMQSYPGAAKYFALPAKLSESLAHMSRRENVTLFMLLLSAWQTLLHRYSGQDEILVGSPVAGRTRVETEGLIGLFLNTLVLRGDLSGDPTFRELLERVRQVALDAYAHQDVPFEKIVDALQPDRDLSRSPLFQVMFVLQNEPSCPLGLPGLKVRPIQVHSGTAKFDLMLSLEELPDGLRGFIEYNTDLFDESTIERMLGHFETLLAGIVADPGMRLSQLPILTLAERRQLLSEWNDTGADFPQDKCIHQLFEKQVELTPDAVAVVFADQELSYRELNDEADRLATRLRCLGVGPEVRVGLCVRRSLEMTIGLLGILKAGGCYVPLDPTYPKERLAFMLKDSEAPVLVTQESLQAELKLEIPNLKQLCLAPQRSTSAGALRGAPPSPSRCAGPDNLAYVIYTSGSTGTPKGVMLTHRNVANFFAGMDRVLGTEPGVWLAVTSISFDISVLELLWTLARGFKVIIQADEERISSTVAQKGGERTEGQWRPVPEQILRHGVTHMQCTPSLAGALVLAPESLEAMRRLSKLLLGGEALPATLAQQLRRSLRGDLLNMYGPTETTVWSTVHRVDDTRGPIPIGRPIANTEIYLLDPSLQPVPTGVPGELFIGGEGVARGYLNRPELTSERFIVHPFKGDAHARLYRTGDLACYRPDGVIEFLGRGDHQIKLRGHRIELGEIEAALREHQEVGEGVVVARETTPGNQQLAAYVVATKGQAPGAAVLRQFLREKLPDYMVPSAFVMLEKFPLTPNGKVDRRSLPVPEEIRPSLETTYIAPRTASEKTVAKIWQDLLRVDKVGLHDNFFDLGGHSLLVVQAQASLRDALGIELPVVRLFQYPTIGALTKFLDERGQKTSMKQTHDRAQRQRQAFTRRPEQEAGV